MDGFITVNNVPLMNTDKAVHLSTYGNDCIIISAIAHFWRSLNLFSALYKLILINAIVRFLKAGIIISLVLMK